MLNGQVIRDMFGRPFKVFGYMRKAPEADTRDKDMIKELARKLGLSEPRILQETVSGMTSYKDSIELKGLIEGMIPGDEGLQEGDVLIISEFSTLGGSLDEVIFLLNKLVKKGVKIYSVKDAYHLDDPIQSEMLLMALHTVKGIERDFKSLRAKEILERKKLQGVKLGRPKGKLGKSKLDSKKEEIRKFLRDDQFSKSRIARNMGVAWPTIDNFIRTRNLA